jgi:Ca-activated chloride channel family protein
MYPSPSSPIYFTQVNPLTMKSILILLALSFSSAFLPYPRMTESERTITGIVIDDSTQPLIFANVFSMCAGTGTQTDLEGRFSITIPDSCKFLDASYTGYPTQRVDITGRDSITVVLKSGAVLNTVEIRAYKVPLVEQDNTTQGGIKTAKQIRNLPTKNINALGATTAGLSSQKGNTKYKGTRDNSTNYYLDGVGVQPSSQNNATHQPQQQVTPEVEFHTEDYSQIVENEFHSPTDAPLSTFSVDVDAASYSNVRRHLNYGMRPPKAAVRIEELINYFDYTYPQPTGDAPIAVFAEVAECPWKTGHKLVHIGIQGKAIPSDDFPVSNLVFLIDVSGSMQDENKLPLVIASFKLLVEQLREKDHVAIVVYAGASGLVLPSTPGNKKHEIIAALENLRAGGSTAGAAGINLAYKIALENFIPGGNNRVILATDGDFNIGVSSDGELVELIEKKRESGVFLSVLGYGMGNYKDNKMQELADHGNGNHGYVDNITEAHKVFVNEFGGTLFTIAKDVKIQVEFNPALVSGYRLIGYENRMLEAEDFNNDKKDAGEIGSNHSVTALYEIIPAGKESASLHTVDELKYQKAKEIKSTSNSDELMTVKFRYKEPDGNTSKLIEHVVYDIDKGFNLASEDFRFSAAVASFGMVLRESEFAGDASIEDIIAWSSQSLGEDKNGYRKEFLELARSVPTIPDLTVEK